MADALLLRVHAQVQQLKKKMARDCCPDALVLLAWGHMGLDGSVLRCSWCRLYCCFTAALLLLYCCFTAHMGLDGSVLRCSWCRLYCCFTAALLLLYCCSTAALLLLYCCFTAVLLRYQLRDTGSEALAADAIRVTKAALLQLLHALLQLTLYA
jgi:hypothetical protein